jgi:hypothetical protein
MICQFWLFSWEFADVNIQHGMIDLMWWVWQLMDFDDRRYVISGTR